MRRTPQVEAVRNARVVPYGDDRKDRRTHGGRQQDVDEKYDGTRAKACCVRCHTVVLSPDDRCPNQDAQGYAPVILGRRRGGIQGLHGGTHRRHGQGSTID